MAEEQKEAKRGVGRPRTRPRKPIDELQGIGPDERERFARFLEAYIPGLERALEEGSTLLATGQDWPGAAAQMHYWRVAIGIHRQLAWNLRVSKGGPLAGSWKKAKPPV